MLFLFLLWFSRKKEKTEDAPFRAFVELRKWELDWTSKLEFGSFFFLWGFFPSRSFKHLSNQKLTCEPTQIQRSGILGLRSFARKLLALHHRPSSVFACFFLFFFLKFNFYLKEKLVQVCFEMFVDRFLMIGRLRVSSWGCENLELWFGYKVNRERERLPPYSDLNLGVFANC